MKRAIVLVKGHHRGRIWLFLDFEFDNALNQLAKRLGATTVFPIEAGI